MGGAAVARRWRSLRDSCEAQYSILQRGRLSKEAGKALVRLPAGHALVPALLEGIAGSLFDKQVSAPCRPGDGSRCAGADPVRSRLCARTREETICRCWNSAVIVWYVRLRNRMGVNAGLNTRTPGVDATRKSTLWRLESTVTSTLSAYTSRFCRWHVLPLLKTLLDLVPHALAPTFLPRPCSLALSDFPSRARSWASCMQMSCARVLQDQS